MVPGTAAGAAREAGLTAAGLDDQDWWFRTSFEAGPAQPGEQLVLRLDGVATLAEVFLNGESVLRSDSMFARHAIDVGARLAGRNELAIRCRALSPELAVQRRPRARWRTRLVADNNLRWFRSMLLGRIPGFAPGPAAVGPWRPIWLERRRGPVVTELELRPRLDGSDGLLSVSARVESIGGGRITGAEVELDGPSGQHRIALETSSDGAGSLLTGELRIPGVERWWPHTHGIPALHDVRLVIRGETSTVVEAGRVGFRSLAPGAAADHDLERDGLFVHVNDVPVFARGALWTPLDIVGLVASPDALRAALQTVRAAGMNMVRLPGFGAYEVDAFHDLCDELGLLVWQDLMYMSMDYPFADEAFGRAAADEVRTAAGVRGRPAQPRRRVRQQRGRAAGRDARAGHGPGPDPVLRRGRPGGDRGGRLRRDLRPVCAMGWRPAHPARPRRDELLRRRRVSGAPVRCANERYPVRGGVPRLRQRA